MVGAGAPLLRPISAAADPSRSIRVRKRCLGSSRSWHHLFSGSAPIYAVQRPGSSARKQPFPSLPGLVKTVERGLFGACWIEGPLRPHLIHGVVTPRNRLGHLREHDTRRWPHARPGVIFPSYADRGDGSDGLRFFDVGHGKPPRHTRFARGVCVIIPQLERR